MKKMLHFFSITTPLHICSSILTKSGYQAIVPKYLKVTNICSNSIIDASEVMAYLLRKFF